MLLKADEQQVFRFCYKKEACERVKPEYSPHSGYKIKCLRQPVDVADALVFRYRTDKIDDLRLILKLDNQTLIWFLELDPSRDWKRVQLPLYKHFQDSTKGIYTKSMHATTFAQVPEGQDSVYLDLDGFWLETTPLNEEQRIRYSENIQRRKRQYKALDENLEIQNLATAKKCYHAGKDIRLDWDYVNASTDKLIIPLDHQSSFSMYVIGKYQGWIEPLDSRARAMDFGNAAHEGDRYACGGRIIPVSGSIIEPGQAFHQFKEMFLGPGCYRFYVELRSVTSDVTLCEESVEFEVLDE